MKPLYILAAAGIAVSAMASTKLQGQGPVHQELLTWGSGNSRTLLLLGNNVYMDSANTGTYVRIDNTADSCSNAINIGGVTIGLYPMSDQALSLGVRSKDADSGTFVMRVGARQMKPGVTANRAVQYFAWSPYGKYALDSTVVNIDSVRVPTPGVTTKTRLSGLKFWVDYGEQLRFCADDLAGTANGTTDSVFVDSVLYKAR